MLKVKTSKYQKHKKQIQNSFNVPPPLLTKEDSCGPPVAKTYLDNSNGLHHSSNNYNKVRLLTYILYFIFHVNICLKMFNITTSAWMVKML